MPKGVYAHTLPPWNKGHRRGAVPESFWDSVRKTEGCWFWTAGRISSGYGIDGNELAHRRAWILTGGPIPAGLFVCHTCDVKTCVRPSHLFLGTNSDNLQDSIQKGRFRTGFRERHPACVNGHAFTPANTYFQSSCPGTRMCKECRREKYQRWLRKNPYYHRDWKRRKTA